MQILRNEIEAYHARIKRYKKVLNYMVIHQS